MTVLSNTSSLAISLPVCSSHLYFFMATRKLWALPKSSILSSWKSIHAKGSGNTIFLANSKSSLPSRTYPSGIFKSMSGWKYCLSANRPSALSQPYSKYVSSSEYLVGSQLSPPRIRTIANLFSEGTQTIPSWPFISLFFPSGNLAESLPSLPICISSLSVPQKPIITGSQRIPSLSSSPRSLCLFTLLISTSP